MLINAILFVALIKKPVDNEETVNNVCTQLFGVKIDSKLTFSTHVEVNGS